MQHRRDRSFQGRRVGVMSQAYGLSLAVAVSEKMQVLKLKRRKLIKQMRACCSQRKASSSRTRPAIRATWIASAESEINLSSSANHRTSTPRTNIERPSCSLNATTNHSESSFPIVSPQSIVDTLPYH